MLLASSSAFAQGTPERRAACMGDAFRYCGSEISERRQHSPRACGQTQADPACKTVFLKG